MTIKRDVTQLVYDLGLTVPFFQAGVTQIMRLIAPVENLAVNGALAVSRETLAVLREYSTTLPTGTKEGKVWKRRTRDGWLLGRFGAPYPAGHELHGRIPVEWYPLIVIGEPARFPPDVRVPPPGMRGLPADAPPGWDLPDGLYLRAGRVIFYCVICGERTELCCDPRDFDPDMAYCGRSSRCCP